MLTQPCLDKGLDLGRAGLGGWDYVTFYTFQDETSAALGFLEYIKHVRERAMRWQSSAYVIGTGSDEATSKIAYAF